MPTPGDIASCRLKSFPMPPEPPDIGTWPRLGTPLMQRVNLFAYGNVLDTFKRCLTTAQLRLMTEESAGADVVIHPFFCESRWYDFDNFNTYIEAGRRATEAALPAHPRAAGPANKQILQSMKPFLSSPLWDAAQPEFWEAWQLRRLREFLKRRVLPFSAHYRRLFAEHGIRTR